MLLLSEAEPERFRMLKDYLGSLCSREPGTTAQRPQGQLPPGTIISYVRYLNSVYIQCVASAGLSREVIGNASLLSPESPRHRDSEKDLQHYRHMYKIRHP